MDTEAEKAARLLAYAGGPDALKNALPEAWMDMTPEREPMVYPQLFLETEED